MRLVIAGGSQAAVHEPAGGERRLPLRQELLCPVVVMETEFSMESTIRGHHVYK